MADTTIYRTKLYQVYEIPKHDELVQGAVTRDYIQVTPGTAEIRRGMLLMSSDAGFTPATKDGIAGAKEFCICCSDFPVETLEGEDGSILLVWAYFSGTFKGTSIILPYETDEDDHDELIEALRVTFRSKNIFIQ